jgi:acyl carrier protein
MTLQEKLAAIEEMMDLEAGALKPDTDLNAIEEWDSLAALSYVVFMTDEFNRQVSGATIRAFKTVQDILNTMEPAA